jgi:hypothetical protein
VGVSDVRESQHVEPYLDTNAWCGALRGLTIGTYLDRVLRGIAEAEKAPRRDILAGMERDIDRRVEGGEVCPLPAADWRHGIAYHRVADIRWPLVVPLRWWLGHYLFLQVPLEIDCSHHLRRCGIGSVHGTYISRLVPLVDLRMLDVAIAIPRPQQPGILLERIAQDVLLAATKALAERPDEPVSADATHVAVIGCAAALLHATNCLEAEAIMRAVKTEIERTGRVAYALRSAADPAWVLARALETA